MLILDDQGRVDVPARFKKMWLWEPDSATPPSWGSLGGSASDANMVSAYVNPETGIPGLSMTTAAAGSARATFHGPKINLNQQGLLAVRLHVFMTGGANAFPTDGGINLTLSLGNEGPANAGVYAAHVGSPRANIRTFTAAGGTDNDSTIDNQSQDRMYPSTGIKQRNELCLWATPPDRRAYYGRSADYIDFKATSLMDLGVIDPFVRISTRHSQAVNMVLHRFALTAWYA